MRVLLALFLLLGCRPEAPAELPPPARSQPTASGRMVRAGSVRGYIARPVADGSGRTGTLVLVDAHDDDSRAVAMALAEQGGVALAIDAGTELGAARTYLDGMADVGRVVVQCKRASCP